MVALILVAAGGFQEIELRGRFHSFGAGSIVRAGACVKQRSRFPALAVLDGFPALKIGSLDAPPDPPAWAFTPESLATVARLRP